MAALTVLYVDDDDAAFFLLELAIREAKPGVDLRRAANGEEALDYLRHHQPYQNAPQPDLIILDLNLPKKTGMEFLDEMKHDHSLRLIPVIVFSSSSLSEDKKQSLALGAQDYVTKPMNLSDFFDAVTTMVSETGLPS